MRTLAAAAVAVLAVSVNASAGQAQQLPAGRADQADSSPEPPLVRAVLTGSLDDVKKTLAGGADVNLPAGSGVTALAAAALQGKVDVIEALITAGAGGRMFEVTKEGAIVWEYMFPLFSGANASNAVYRAYRIAYGWIPQLKVPTERRVTPPALGEFRVP